MPKKQKLKNKGNYVGNLTDKSQEQRFQDNRTRASFDQNVDIFVFLNLTLQAQKNAMASVLELISRCFGAGEAFYLVQ